MCAYNSVDGQPACASTRLLGDILREQWGFQGYVVSDCGAMDDVYPRHKAAPTATEAVARRCAPAPTWMRREYENLVQAVRQGFASEADVNQAAPPSACWPAQARHVRSPLQVRYAQIPYSVNDSPAHRNWPWRRHANRSSC